MVPRWVECMEKTYYAKDKWNRVLNNWALAEIPIEYLDPVPYDNAGVAKNRLKSPLHVTDAVGNSGKVRMAGLSHHLGTPG